MLGNTNHALEMLNVRFNEAILDISKEVIRDAEKNIENIYYTRFME